MIHLNLFEVLIVYQDFSTRKVVKCNDGPCAKSCWIKRNRFITSSKINCIKFKLRTECRKPKSRKMLSITFLVLFRQNDLWGWKIVYLLMDFIHFFHPPTWIGIPALSSWWKFMLNIFVRCKRKSIRNSLEARTK